MGEVIVDPIHRERAINERRARSDGWCILRTNGRRTLRLADSLNAAGIEAWTPIVTHKRRLSRIHMGVQQVDGPMLPSFVFARARHVQDLLRCLSMPTNPHPAFTIFLHGGRAPVIADREIDRLRRAEDEAKPRARRRTVAIGAKISPTEGPFAGLTGVVEEVQGKDAVIHFGGAMRFKISAWLLAQDTVDGS